MELRKNTARLLLCSLVSVSVGIILLQTHVSDIIVGALSSTSFFITRDITKRGKSNVIILLVLFSVLNVAVIAALVYLGLNIYSKP